MEVTVYADVLMAVNFLIDYLLLLFCGRLGGRAIFRRRLLLGALIGALVSLVIFLPPLPFWAMTGIKLLSAAAMVALAFRWQGVRGFCWDVFLFFTVSFLLAGICLGLWLGFGAGGLFCRNGVTYFQVSLPVLLGTVSGAYLLLTLYDRLRRSPAGETAAVTLSRNGRTIRLRALRDSGNRLKEPFSGSPVAVAELAPVLSLLTEEEAAAALAPDYPTGESPPVAPPGALPDGAGRRPAAGLPAGPGRSHRRRRGPCRRPARGGSDGGRHPGTAGGRPLPAAAAGGLFRHTCEEGREVFAVSQRIGTLLSRLFDRLFDWLLPGSCHYLGGSQVLPAPLDRETEQEVFRRLSTGDPEARRLLIEHNLRLVIYIARKFESTGVGLEDLISIGSIGLIKAVNTFCPEKNIKLATYASRCIENEILMHLRKIQNQRGEVSIDEPLNTDWDGNELMLSDILGTEPDITSRPIEESAEQALLLSAVDRLSDRERQIMHLRFGLRGGTEHTQKEVADAIGISQSYISRLEKRILSRLRQELCDLGL